MTESELLSFRKEFPITGNCVYFNHASTGPMPLSAVEAISGFARRCALEGEVPYAEVEAAIAETRVLAAQLLRVRPEEIAFARNTSSGIILAIGTQKWQPGDNVIIMSDAFPANSYPFRFLLPDVEKRCVTSSELAAGPDCVFRLADERTRMVSLDWVHSWTGIRCDIQAIARFCRQRQIRFVVDAIQGLGTIDMDFSELQADFVCASVAKWLLGPQGIAILYVNRETLPQLRPFNLGWLSAQWQDFNDMHTPRPLKPGADRYEEGTRNHLGIYGLRASLQLLLQAGLPAIEARIRQLGERLRAGLIAAGYRVVTPEKPEQCGNFIVADRPETDMSALHAYLLGRKLHCALRENRLRIAPHFYNSEEEVTQFLDALRSYRN